MLSTPTWPRVNSSNGSGPSRPPNPPIWQRFPRLTCGSIAVGVGVVLLLLFIIGLAHPYVVLGIGALMVLGFGGALLFWKD